MEFKVLGTGCAKCEKLANNVQEAATELGIEFNLEKVTDLNKIYGYGVMMTPALVIDGDVKVVGKASSVEEIKKLIS
jgi:small redox-active disulfide protein 2